MNLLVIIISIASLIRYSLQEKATSVEGLLDETFSDIIKITRARDVISIARDQLGDKETRDILKVISKAITSRVPTLQVDSDFREGISAMTSRNPSFMMSRDLLLYVYVSSDVPDRLNMKKISADLISFIERKTRPKILILMMLQKEKNDFIPLFDLLWKSKMMDVTILECSIEKRTKSGFKFGSIHRYDPFKRTSTEQPFSTSADWFSEKFPSMQGYPLIYTVFDRPPYSVILNDSRKDAFRNIRGVDGITFQVLQKKMNFTPVWSGQRDVGLISRKGNNTADTIFSFVMNNSADIIATRIPMIFLDFYSHVKYSITVQIEKWCFVVPKLRVRRDLLHETSFAIVLVTISIVVIFWLCSVVLKFDRRRWNPITIIGMLLCVPITTVPERHVEKIIFLCALAAAGQYSSLLFAQLTSINIDNVYSVQFDRFSDLLNSGLAIMSYEEIFKVILEDNKVLQRFFVAYTDKVKFMDSMYACIDDLVQYKNVTCYMDDSWAGVVANTFFVEGEKVVEVTKFCFISPRASYVFQKGSPYVDRINEILFRILESGIYDKWYYDDILRTAKTTENYDGSYDAGKVHVAAYYQMIYFVAVCYGVSFVAFLAELFYKLFEKKRANGGLFV